MDRISRIQNPKALHVVQLIIIIVKQIYRKGERKVKKKMVGWLVISIWMRLLSSASLPRSMHAPWCSSPLWDLGLLHPSHLFLCVIGWIWCFFVYLTSTCSLLVLPPPLSLHDDCVISFSLTHTYTHIQLSFIKFFLPVSSLSISITRSNHPYLIHSFLSPQSFRISTFTPLFQLPSFSFSQKPQTTNHESTPFPPPSSTTPSTPTTAPAPSPLHNSKQ